MHSHIHTHHSHTTHTPPPPPPPLLSSPQVQFSALWKHATALETKAAAAHVAIRDAIEVSPRPLRHPHPPFLFPPRRFFGPDFGPDFGRYVTLSSRDFGRYAPQVTRAHFVEFEASELPRASAMLEAAAMIGKSAAAMVATQGLQPTPRLAHCPIEGPAPMLPESPDASCADEASLEHEHVAEAARPIVCGMVAV